ncbi:type VI secretion system membrane subunit TssM [Duganella sp. Root336D2]|uniref:type VI secretion system membrane subunit TssM n=1 Tax=Duganella sp. Root336D2 TaxID=1736518 RepID=UPI0006F7D113|nr:type VI secretion system membrane subunit TssM [Duganella sp. Root336D2]KQV45837.1 type VI secretion protein VasK [Duganella sp. Root336D2]
MLQRTWYLLTDRRTLNILAFAVVAGLLFVGAGLLQLALVWALAGVAALAVLALTVCGVRRYLARRRETEPAPPAEARAEADLEAVRSALLEALGTIRNSRLGHASGARALYELPWYMVIGNPAAGKSSAITQSGLQFPFADQKAIQGVGGTRHCDWFFTAQGILLDTAGRYAVQAVDREEWHGFLELLKKHRPRAPINGIVIAVSIAELRGDETEPVLQLARSLRQRVQDLIEKLEVFAPVYVMFTKADLVAGFADFFADADAPERERPWGATMPFKQKAGCGDMLAFFEQSFDELCQGLREMGIASMTQRRRELVPAGVHTFPLEFAALRAPLMAFLATLFEDNPFQFRPLFRGYYFTSALQEGQPLCAQSLRVAQRFGLALPADAAPRTGSGAGYFLPRLFREVIFADKDLVSQYATRKQRLLRNGGFTAAILLLGAALGAWTWSYSGNAQLVANAAADLDKAVKMQAQSPDLQSRLEALQLLQDRIEQLDKLERESPWLLGMGLYQGDALGRKLRSEYFKGMGEILLKPVAASLETQLFALGQREAGNVEDSYNALKTYLMLADKSHAETGHLGDQLTRHWRSWLETNRGAMPREQLLRSAEGLLAFYLSQLNDPAWPRIEARLAMVDTARGQLRKVVRGMTARERVYAEIKARASTRYPAMTVARIVGAQDRELVQGSHAVSGAFTREAWEGYVRPAIREAANSALQSSDWVLKTAERTDLTLEGSPEQVQKALTESYKSDYAKEWQAFLQGVVIARMPDFPHTVEAMNRLGDPAISPLLKVWNTVAAQTSWDSPGLAAAGVQQAEQGLAHWFKARLFERAPAAGAVAAALPQAGALGREFAPVAGLLAARDKDGSLMRTYLEHLSRLRARLNGIGNQGDPGPGARQLMQQTLEGQGSELSEALRHVDEQMMAGLDDAQKQAIRPLLVRPLIQVFAGLLAPAEAEINKTWQAQVYQPFNRTLAGKFPFAPAGSAEASQAEIGQVFGPEGAIAKFVGNSLGALVVRRGDVLAPRTWADIGIGLSPQTLQRFPAWMAPLAAGGVASATQTLFQLLPHAASGLAEYSIEIDGQLLRFRNSAPQWVNMVYPGPQGSSGVRISGVTPEGKVVELFGESGAAGLRKMIDSASRTRKEEGVHELRWSSGAVAVSVDLRITSAPGSAQGDGGFRGMRLPETVAGKGSAP